MAEKFTFNTPHPDIELGLPREPIDYFVTTPRKGIKKNTGLVLFIPGFGMLSDSPYVLDKLAPYIADKYNCLVVSVNYFGIHNRQETGAYYRLADDFFDRLREIYNIEASTSTPTISLTQDNLPALQNFAYNALSELSKVLSVKWLDPRCQVFLDFGKGEYESFGLLPAVDHLQITGEILKRYTLDTRRIIVFGSSYGGYIASLMGKFAPNTFSTIIDNSGFVKANIRHTITQELMMGSGHYLYINNLHFHVANNSPWTLIDEYSAHYFSDSHRNIRSLLHEPHFQKSSAQYHVFHSSQDQFTATIASKDKQVFLLKKYATVFYHRIEAQNIDGRVFKTMEHGMNASLRGVFDLAAQESKRKLFKAEYDNDFTLNKIHKFCCSGRNYNFHFREDYSLEISITSDGD